MSSHNTLHILFYCYIFLFLIDSSTSTVLVKAGNSVNYSCDKNIYYLSIDVVFSEKPKNEMYPFTLTLAAPDNFNFKCMLDYSQSNINCLRAFSDEDDFIVSSTYLQFPYPFPELEDIEWDYETFLQKIYRKVWTPGSDCGNLNIFNKSDTNYKEFDIQGVITSLDNGLCQPASVSNETISKYTFDMNITFDQNKIDNDSNIEFMQEIWVPLLPQGEVRSKNRLKTYHRPFSFAKCKANYKITKDNYDNFVLNCELPIKTNAIFNGVIKVGAFFDELYAKQNKNISRISLYINLEKEDNEQSQKNYITLSDKDQGIICPNQPLFTIDNKESILMGVYNSETSKYTFSIKGTLSNGYYVFKNGTSVELNETYKDIHFQLKVEDNLLDSDENEVMTACTLPIGSPFQIYNKAEIKCIGQKNKKIEQNNNVDITLNWNLKVNNNFNNIMISWPKKNYDESNKKNIYLYQLTGLSIRQSNFACHNNNFDFYVYIYNLYREPKISFDLPLTLPKSNDAKCELFDTTALRCSLNLKHKKLLKGAQVMLPMRGSENEIFTNEGNRIIFTMNNFSKINNDHDFYVKLEEECGDNVFVGTLKDMGMSHKSSVLTYIFIIIIAIIIIVGFVLYFIWKIKKRIEGGAKLAASEETKGGNTTVGAKA